MGQDERRELMIYVSEGQDSLLFPKQKIESSALNDDTQTNPSTKVELDPGRISMTRYAGNIFLLFNHPVISHRLWYEHSCAIGIIRSFDHYWACRGGREGIFGHDKPGSDPLFVSLGLTLTWLKRRSFGVWILQPGLAKPTARLT
jgi:hypothetical protein